MAGVAAAGHEVLPVLLERDGAGAGPTAGRSRSRPAAGLLGADVAFPVLHGPFGEDGTVQGLLELLDVPYVGAGVLASSLCMDKIVFKDVLAAAGVPQVALRRRARGALARRAGRGARRARPARAAPVRQAGAARVLGRHRQGPRRPASSAHALDAAFAHDGLVIAEAFSAGIEVECAVMGLYEAEASVPGEVVLLGGAEWYDYEAKYTDGGIELQVPARIPRGRGGGGAPAGGRDVPARRLRRPRAGRLLRRGRRAGAGQRAQHAARHDADVRVPEAVGGRRRPVAAGRATGCWRSRWSATPPSGRGARLLAARTLGRSVPKGSAG